MKIMHKEAFPFVFIVYTLLICIGVCMNLLFPKQSVFHCIIYAGILYMFIYFFLFFRNPVRPLEKNDRQVISPADGKVVVIEEIDEQQYFFEKRIQVSIFMSPHVPHVNKSPISGIIRSNHYKPGRHLVAFHPKSSDLNESNAIIIEKEGFFTLGVKQIAGAVARRIIAYVKEGDVIEQGEELGFIKFGSRVDLFLPVNMHINVNLEEKVKAAYTVIATLPE